MTTLDFSTSAKKAEERASGKAKMSIVLDGRKMRIKRPAETSIVLTMARAKRGEYDRVVEFMLNLFADPDDREYITERLEDEDDPFDLQSDDPEQASLMSIYQAVMENMGGRPTGSAPASSGSQTSTGKTSTGGARVKASRRSTSRSTGS